MCSIEIPGKTVLLYEEVVTASRFPTLRCILFFVTSTWEIADSPAPQKQTSFCLNVTNGLVLHETTQCQKTLSCISISNPSLEIEDC